MTWSTPVSRRARRRFPAAMLASAMLSSAILSCAMLLAWCVAAGAAAPAKRPVAAPILPGSDPHDPVNIEADRLEYFNTERKAIYFGKVVAVQGDSTLKCSKLTILLDQQLDNSADSKTAEAKTAEAKPPRADAGSGGLVAGGGGVRHMYAEGPVTLISKEDVGTGDRAEYDKPANKMYLIGHVVLTQNGNVTKGDRLTYDTTTGVAVVESGGSAGRVSGLFLPGSSQPGSDKPAAIKPGAPRAGRSKSERKAPRSLN